LSHGKRERRSARLDRKPAADAAEKNGIELCATRLHSAVTAGRDDREGEIKPERVLKSEVDRDQTTGQRPLALVNERHSRLAFSIDGGVAL
jgi:hypothetical protein